MNLSTVKRAQWDKTQSIELLGLFICVCIALCTIAAHNIAQNRPDNFPSYPPDNHHCSDDVYLREGDHWSNLAITTSCNIRTNSEKAQFSWFSMVSMILVAASASDSITMKFGMNFTTPVNTLQSLFCLIKLQKLYKSWLQFLYCKDQIANIKILSSNSKHKWWLWQASWLINVTASLYVLNLQIKFLSAVLKWWLL